MKKRDGGEYLKLVTYTQAAEIVGVTRQRIALAVTQGHLTPVPDLPVKLLKREDVEQFRDREKSKGGRPRKQTEAHE